MNFCQRKSSWEVEIFPSSRAGVVSQKLQKHPNLIPTPVVIPVFKNSSNRQVLPLGKGLAVSTVGSHYGSSALKAAERETMLVTHLQSRCHSLPGELQASHSLLCFEGPRLRVWETVPLSTSVCCYPICTVMNTCQDGTLGDHSLGGWNPRITANLMNCELGPSSPT